MYSFNLDYIFNAFYNLLLAIRYLWLFVILRIDKDTYLADHVYDSWDGLRDYGWIKSSSETDISSIVAARDLSSWERFVIFIKEKMFGIHDISNTKQQYGTDLSGIDGSNTLNVIDGVSKTNAGFVLDKTNNSFLDSLHFSIQNPLLSFAADVLTIFAFFVFLILIYTFLAWVWVQMGDHMSHDREHALEEREEKIKEIEEHKKKTGHVKHVYTFDEKLNLTEEQKAEKIKEYEERYRREYQNEIKHTFEKELDRVSSHNQRDYHKVTEDDMHAFLESVMGDEEKSTDESLSATLFNKEGLGVIELNENDNQRVSEHESQMKDWKNRWSIVESYMESSEEALWRIAIMEADNLLNDVLIEKGYEGETVAEKLRVAKFRTIELAWEAHRLRNRIAHEGSKFILAEKVARKSVAMFEAVMMEMKVL